MRDQVELSKENPGTGIFANSITEYIHGLVKNSTFQLVKKDELTDETRMFGSRIIVEINNSSNNWHRKSRPVAQSYIDENAAKIVTKPLTSLVFRERLLYYFAFVSKMEAQSTDVEQTLVRSIANLK